MKEKVINKTSDLREDQRGKGMLKVPQSKIKEAKKHESNRKAQQKR